MNDVVMAEVARAEEVLRVCDLLGCALVDERAAESAQDVAEAALERWAIATEGHSGSGLGGLVSIPTTPTKLAEARMQASERLLRERLRAQVRDRTRGRVSRMRCKVGLAAKGHVASTQEPGFRPHYVAMLTLTYSDGSQWSGEHLTRFVDCVRRHLAGRGIKFRYVWVAELQKRGAIHYHFAVWLPPGVKLPKPDQAGWWQWGSTNIEAARNAVPYLMSYLKKDKFRDAAELPKGARLHGAGGMDRDTRRMRWWCSLPGFIRARADIHDDWRRAKGGGWSTPDGFVVPSEFERVKVGSKWCCVRVIDHGRPFPAEGPFSWISRGEQRG